MNTPWEQGTEEENRSTSGASQAELTNTCQRIQIDGEHTTLDTTADPKGERDIHEWFGLSYSNYLVVERTLLQSMPLSWQQRLTALLSELEERFRGCPRADVFSVRAAEEREVAELAPREREAAGVDREWEPTEDPEGGRWLYFVDGTEREQFDRVLVPVTDPVPHYDRGRTYIASTEENV